MSFIRNYFPEKKYKTKFFILNIITDKHYKKEGVMLLFYVGNSDYKDKEGYNYNFNAIRQSVPKTTIIRKTQAQKTNRKQPLQNILYLSNSVHNMYTIKLLNYIYHRFYIEFENNFFISYEILAQNIQAPISEVKNSLYYLEKEKIIDVCISSVLSIKKPL